MRRERHLEIEIDERRRFVSRERGPHDALVHEIEKCVPRYAGLLRQHGDLRQRLRDDAQKNVVADLDDPWELALADVTCRRSDHLEIRQRVVECGFWPRANEP